jgi:hypothetical protein
MLRYRPKPAKGYSRLSLPAQQLIKIKERIPLRWLKRIRTIDLEDTANGGEKSYGGLAA